MSEETGRGDAHGEDRPMTPGEAPGEDPWPSRGHGAFPEAGPSAAPQAPMFAAPPAPGEGFPAGYGRFREDSGPGASGWHRQGAGGASTMSTGAFHAAPHSPGGGSAGPPPGGPPGGWPTGGQWGGGGPAAPPRPRRRMPLWGVILLALAVALISGTAGGGAALWLSGAEEESASPLEESDVPEDVPSRPADTIAGVAQRVIPSVVSVQGSQGLEGNGSGFVIEGGHIVTNHHVAAAIGGDIEVVYSDGHETTASVVGSAASSDLAVLEVADAPEVEPLAFGASEDLTVGDTVIAIGAPLGLEGTVTTGIISAQDRPVTVGAGGGDASYFSALQTDAAINPGNSGGPLVNLQGEVIGVNSAIATMGSDLLGQSGSIGLGFAIPSAQAERILEELVETGESQHAVIGAYLDMRYQDRGAMIIEDPAEGEENQEPALAPDGPADRAGLEPGDVITEFDGEPVGDAEELIVMVRNRAPGDTVEVAFERDGRTMNTELTLDASEN